MCSFLRPKRFSRFVVCIVCTWLGSAVFAQEKTAGIYDFIVQVQDSIYDDRREEEILDTLKNVTADKIGRLLKAKVDFIYKINKRGKTIGSPNVFGHIGLLPSSTFKRAAKHYSRDYYIAISCRILSVGGQRLANTDQKTKIAPLVNLKVTVYDREKKVMYKKEVERGDFGNVKSEAQHRTLIGRSISNFLFGKDKEITAVEVLYMYVRTLELIN